MSFMHVVHLISDFFYFGTEAVQFFAFFFSLHDQLS